MGATGWGLLGAYLVVANLVSFLLFGWDKSRARRGARRIPERTLLWSAALSGTVGAWLAMRVFRHKTVKASFRRGMVLATVADAAVLVLVLVAARG